jgi:hypothetical protein
MHAIAFFRATFILGLVAHAGHAQVNFTTVGVTRQSAPGAGAGAEFFQFDQVVRAGDVAPGTTDSTRFASFSDPVFTAAGTVAFMATLTGRGVIAENDTGIWAVRPGGALQLVIRESTSLALAEGDSRRIRDGGLLLFSNQGGDETNSTGVVQLVFQASFIDGESALSVATLNAPAPRIGLVRRSAGQVELQFQTVSALTYSVEYSTSGAANSWRTLKRNLYGTGGRMAVTDTIQFGQPARLYRVKVL